MVDKPYHEIVIGCPIPRRFFKTTGKGESDYQIHAGSYHIAMAEAGIQGANLIPYTSILPPEAIEITPKMGMKRIHHGSEMKVIQAAAHIDLKDPEIKKYSIKQATAAIRFAWLRPKEEPEAAHVGGLVCEYNGHGTVEEAQKNLDLCMDRIYKHVNKANGRSYSQDFDLHPQPLVSATVEPKMRFGTALAALAFVDYVIRVPKSSPKELEAVISALQSKGL